MRRVILPRAALAAGALLWLAVAAPAADLDKYLPDDAQSVVVVNVKQITSWPPFQKQFQDQLQQFLKAEPFQNILKDTGFDPLRDVDRVVIVVAASSTDVVKPPGTTAPTPPKPPPGAAAPPPGLPPPPPPAGFPTFILIQGKFDADKLEAKSQQALKDHPDAVKKPRMVHGMELWEIGTGPVGTGPGADPVYLAMLDKETMLATDLESQALEALDKAAGKKKTDLKDKQVRDGLAAADPKAAVLVVASGDWVTGGTLQSDGKGGFTTTTRTLRDEGFEGFRGAVTLGDADLHLQVNITAKDADKAKATAKEANDRLEAGIKEVTAAVPMNTELQPLVDILKSVKIAASGDVLTLEGNSTADTLDGGIKAFYRYAPSDFLRPRDVSKPPDLTPPVKPPDDPKTPKKDK